MFELLELVDKTEYLFIVETSFQTSQEQNLKGFNLQLQALQNLVLYDVTCWPRIVTSFSPKENFIKLKKIISEIDRKLAEEIEIEDIFLLPHVKERLKKANIKPFTYYKTIELDKREECK